MASEARLLLVGRALRALCDGYVAILLPVYLLTLGLGQWEVGLISTATLLGSALATLAIGRWGHRFPQRRLLLAAGWLMAATGTLLAGLSDFWPLLVVAFVGTMNPSSGDVSIFLPLEHARLAEAAQGEARTFLFARYTFIGAFCAAVGSLATAIPQVLTNVGMAGPEALRLMFLAYGLAGIAIFFLYRRLPNHRPHEQAAPPAPLGPSRRIVMRLAALFSLDAFAGGLIVNTLLALWLFERFELSLAAAGQFFFWAGLLSAGSQLAAPWVARRIGLINTMVFTHIPSSPRRWWPAAASRSPTIWPSGGHSGTSRRNETTDLEWRILSRHEPGDDLHLIPAAPRQGGLHGLLRRRGRGAHGCLRGRRVPARGQRT